MTDDILLYIGAIAFIVVIALVIYGCVTSDPMQ